jgi:hypothetical protein
MADDGDTFSVIRCLKGRSEVTHDVRCHYHYRANCGIKALPPWVLELEIACDRLATARPPATQGGSIFNWAKRGQDWTTVDSWIPEIASVTLVTMWPTQVAPV